MKDKWLMLTAGLGTVELEAAANRIFESASNRFDFLDAFVIVGENIAEFAPQTIQKYGDFLSVKHKGYGYFAWKSELVLSALSGKMGPYKGVIWVDAGCEVTLNKLSLNRLKGFMETAERDGVFVFNLNYPENQYTKAELLIQFPNINPHSLQIQATWFLASKEKGTKLIQAWHDSVQQGISQVDLSYKLEQDAEFVQHRFDQSVLSLTLKNYGIQPSTYIPPSGRGFLSIFTLRGITHPIWSSRNRYGKSIKSKLFLLVERFF
jgi:hypothetical protein